MIGQSFSAPIFPPVQEDPTSFLHLLEELLEIRGVLDGGSCTGEAAQGFEGLLWPKLPGDRGNVRAEGADGGTDNVQILVEGGLFHLKHRGIGEINGHIKGRLSLVEEHPVGADGRVQVQLVEQVGRVRLRLDPPALGGVEFIRAGLPEVVVELGIPGFIGGLELRAKLVVCGVVVLPDGAAEIQIGVSFLKIELVGVSRHSVL